MTKKNWQAVTSAMSLTEDETSLLDSVQAALLFSDAKMLKLMILISTHFQTGNAPRLRTVHLPEQ
jgi:hypothetical protein